MSRSAVRCWLFAGWCTVLACNTQLSDLIPPGLNLPGLLPDDEEPDEGPGFTKIAHVAYDSLAVDEPVTFRIGLRARRGAYDVSYVVRNGVRTDAIESSPFSGRWREPTGSVRIDKATALDEEFAIMLAGPIAPGVYSLRFLVAPSDENIGALAADPVDVAVLVDPPPLRDEDVASWGLTTAQGASIETRQALAEEYAPLLLLANGERYHPQSVETALEQARIRIGGVLADWQVGSARRDVERDARIDAAIEFSTMPAPDPDDTVYYASVHRTGRGLALGYWLFYGASNWKEYVQTANAHQGDWEGLVVLFDGDVPAAWSSGPTRIALAQHLQYSAEVIEALLEEDPDAAPDEPASLAEILGIDVDALDGGEVAHWGSAAVQRIGNHPVLFVGLGSHATYFGPEPDIYICDAVETPTGDGTAVLPPGVSPSDLVAGAPGWISAEVVVLPNHSEIAPGSSFLWLRFAGRWGKDDDGSRGTFGDVGLPEAVCFLPPAFSAGNDGPHGPAFETVLFGEPDNAGLRWRNPHAWADQMNAHAQ